SARHARTNSPTKNCVFRVGIGGRGGGKSGLREWVVGDGCSRRRVSAWGESRGGAGAGGAVSAAAGRVIGREACGAMLRGALSAEGVGEQVGGAVFRVQAA